MKHFLSALLVLCLLAPAAFAQTFAIKGKLVDKTSGEPLIGAGVQVIGSGVSTGAQTEVNGSYKVENIKPGTYEVTATYVGYNSITEKVTISDKDAVVTFRLPENNATLNEIEIVADVAVERETPVAFSAIKESTIRESLAGRDLPLILNETPGVYATSDGGGAGDSKISIRGFSQENIAVMVNGVPVNDMENGAVYWSNWDLGDVTKSTQIQRGLSASKLATPSVGGTLNILTRGYETQRRVLARQEIGSNNYSKTSLMLSSGQLKGDWSVTVYGSRRKGDGWVEGTFDDSWSYFANVSKKLGNHTLSLTGLGSPQKHGQRSFGKTIITYDTEKAKEFGVKTTNPQGTPFTSYGFDYNSDWGSFDRFTVQDGDTTHNVEYLNTRQNFYHKPQVNFNHFWNISDKLFMSNVLYMSIGNGGGVGPASTGTSSSFTSVDGRPAYQSIYNTNYTNAQNGIYPTNPAFFLRAGINNHRWYGFISSLDYRINESTTLSAGIDGRSYRGEHYQEVYDLMGSESVGFGINNGNKNVDMNTRYRKGDKIRYHDFGFVRSIGGFTMLEYKTNVLSAFVSGTLSNTYYNREDFFRAKIYNINGVEKPMAFNTPTLFGDTYYALAESVIVQRKKVLSGQPRDTALVLDYNTPLTYNNRTYLRSNAEGKNQVTGWEDHLGYTIKGGLNYNLNEFNNIFFNLGYISKAPFFKFVFSQAGERLQNVQNEGVMSFEVGYGINRNNFKANLNAYHTTWFDKSLSRSAQVVDQNGNDVLVTYNIAGMDARHVGIELDIAQELSRKVELNAAISLGDWRWNSTGTAEVFTENNEQLPSVNFNAKGVHVGGSAQNQFMFGLRYEPIKGLYIRPTYLLFAKNYANFDPDNLKQARPQDSFRLPTSRNLDIHSGYSFQFYKDYKLTLNASVLNVLNEFYIQDARPGVNGDQFDPNDIEVFFNRGRTFVAGASVSF